MDVKVPSPEDHTGVQILVKLHQSQGDNAANSNFNHVLERLKRIHAVEVSENPKRNIFPVFASSFDKGPVSWGDFQVHRKILGLIFVGYGREDVEEEGGWAEDYAKTKESLKHSIINSRCLLFGLHPDGTTHHNLNEQEVISYEDMKGSDGLESDVKELLKSIFWVMEGKRMDLSFEKSDSPPCPLAPDEGKYRFGLENRHSKNYKKKCIGRLRKQVADYTLLTGLPTLAMEAYAAAIELLKASNDWLWLADERMEPPANGVSKSRVGGMESSTSNQFLFHASRSGINPNEIMEKFKLALENYEKFSFASTIECECIFKAASVYRYETEFCAMESFLREHTGKYLDANFTQFTFMYKAYLCQVLGTMFRQVNFRRKSAFFFRLAALFRLHITEPDAPPRDIQDYRTVYPLLYWTLEGNKLKESVKDMPLGAEKGWADVQIRALHETYVSASRAGFSQAAIRHLCYMLQAFLEDMEPGFVRQLCTELGQIAAAVGKGQPVSVNNHLQLNFDLILRPVSMSKFPKIIDFRLLSLPGYESPRVVKAGPSSVFIYTPFERKEQAAMNWVTGCHSGVALKITNPLPFELHVSNLTIQSEGVSFEPTPVQMTLPPAPSDPLTFKLFGTPLTPGRLTILGYSCEVLGVKNVTKLKEIPWLNETWEAEKKRKGARAEYKMEDQFQVEVLPPLPTLDIQTTLPRAKAYEVEDEFKSPESKEIATAEVTVYSGQRFEHSLTLVNTSETESISKIGIEIDQPRVCGGSPMLELENEPLDGPPGLEPKNEKSLKFAIYGIDPMTVSESDLEDRRPPSIKSASKGDTTSISDNSSISTGAEEKIPYLGRLLVASICVRYQGGSERSGGVFERSAVLTLYITIVPAITVTDWRVLSGDTPMTRYLAVDVTNCSDSEAELHFDTDRRISVQSKEVCRVPLLCPCCEIDGMVFSEPNERRRLVVEMEETERLRIQLERHVSKHLEIFWSIPSLDLSGQVPIGTLLASESFLKQLVLPPLLVGNTSTVTHTLLCPIHDHLPQTGLSVDGVQGQEEHTIGIGVPTSISIELSQSHGERLFAGQLSLSVFQDLQNSSLPPLKPEGHMLFIGPVEQPFTVPPNPQPTLDSDQEQEVAPTSSSQFQVMFCHEGVYKVKPGFESLSNDRNSILRSSDLFLPTVSFNVVTRSK